jgi:hypothetical protein
MASAFSLAYGDAWPWASSMLLEPRPLGMNIDLPQAQQAWYRRVGEPIFPQR